MQTEASFDTWTTLFLVVSAVGTFLSVLLFTDKNGRTHNWPIALLILGFSLVLVEYVFYWTGYNKVYTYTYFFSHSWYFAFGPLLYTYIIRFYKKDFRISPLHYAPAILSLFLTLYYYLRTAGFSSIEEVQGEYLFGLIMTLRSSWIATLSYLVYLWVIGDTIKLFKSDTDTQTSLLRNRWSRFLIRLFGIFTLAYTSYFVLVNFSFFNVAWDYAISVTMSIGIYGIGYMVYTEPQIFNGELFSKLFLEKSEKQEALSEETKEEFYETVKGYFISEKPYRQNDLRLVHVAENLGFSTHLLSQIINEKSGKNFNRFINEYRLTEAESLLISDEIKKVSNLYYHVGFNSKATFYNLFKKKHGCTPTQYRSLKSKG